MSIFLDIWLANEKISCSTLTHYLGIIHGMIQSHDHGLHSFELLYISHSLVDPIQAVISLTTFIPMTIHIKPLLQLHLDSYTVVGMRLI